MAKSKSFRTLRTDDMGNELVFDASAFKDCMSTMASELEKSNPREKVQRNKHAGNLHSSYGANQSEKMIRQSKDG